MACIDHAVRLSPREVFHGAFAQQYAFAYFQGARYRLGLEFAQKAHQLRPGHAYPMVIGAACAGHLGDAGSAAALVKDLKAAHTGDLGRLDRDDGAVRPDRRPQTAHRRNLPGPASSKSRPSPTQPEADGSAKPPWRFAKSTGAPCPDGFGESPFRLLSLEPIRSRHSAVVFTFGKGSSGTGTPRNWHNGPQPSETSKDEQARRGKGLA